MRSPRGRRIGRSLRGAVHASAADLLARVDPEMGTHLRRLVALEPAAHHGERLLSERDRLVAVREATALVTESVRCTT